MERLLTLPIENKVEEMSALFFTISDIAIFIGMERDELKQIIQFKKADPIHIAYRRGKLRTEIKLRYDTQRFALAGNPQASEDMKKYHSQQIIDEDA